MKKIIFLFLLLSSVIPGFAERKTRVDTYGNHQVKIIWNTKYTDGPNNKNWAQEHNRSWAKEHDTTAWTAYLEYYYILNPRNTKDKISDAIVILFINDKASHSGYAYCLTVDIAKDGLLEREFKQYYYDFQYTDAKLAFNQWTSLFEAAVSD